MYRRVSYMLASFLCTLSVATHLHAQEHDTSTPTIHLEHTPRSPSMFLGDARNTAISPFNGPRRDSNILWATRLSSGAAVPPVAASSGHSFWGLHDGSVVALDRGGVVLWRKVLSSPIRSSPALSNDSHTLYVATHDGLIVALAAVDGTIRWTHQLAGNIISSPLLDERAHRMVLSVGETTVALDTRTGKPLFDFHSEIDPDVRRTHTRTYNSSPALGPDGLIRITNWTGFALALSGSGHRVWKTPTGSQGFITAPLIGPLGVLYTVSSRRASPRSQMIAISPTGRPLWSLNLGKRVRSFLGMLPNGDIIALLDGYGVIAVSPQGVVRWRRKLTSPQGGSLGLFGFSLAISSEGVIYTTTYKRKDYSYLSTLWALDGESGALLDLLSFPHHAQAGPVLAAPHRGQHRLLVSTADGFAICVQGTPDTSTRR